MKIATPQSLPEGESSSAGINVSTAATMNAASGAVSVTKGSGSCGDGCAAGDAAGVGCCASTGSAIPAAIAVPARPAPSKNLRRGNVSSAIKASPKHLPMARTLRIERDRGFRLGPSAASLSRYSGLRECERGMHGKHRPFSHRRDISHSAAGTFGFATVLLRKPCRPHLAPSRKLDIDRAIEPPRAFIATNAVTGVGRSVSGTSHERSGGRTAEAFLVRLCRDGPLGLSPAPRRAAPAQFRRGFLLWRHPVAYRRRALRAGRVQARPVSPCGLRPGAVCDLDRLRGWRRRLSRDLARPAAPRRAFGLRGLTQRQRTTELYIR